MVAKLDKLEETYSPHKAGPGQEGGCTTGSLQAKPDVPGPGQQGGRTTGSLHAKSDVLGPGQEGGCTTGSLHAEGDVLGPCHPPYPNVDWTAIRFKPSLPNPVPCPILGVSQDPIFYTRQMAPWGT